MTSEIVPHGSDMAQVLSGPEGDFLRRALEQLLRQVMEAKVTAQVGAALHERSADRTAWRNGYRPRTWETRVGPMLLEIPKLREGTYFPSFLEPRKRSERALLAVQEAYVHGVSTRKVDDLVKALGCSGIDKSTVSRICKELDEEAEHVGIATDRVAGGKPMVISNSLRAREVSEEPWDVFAGGREVSRDSRHSPLPSAIVIERARRLLGRGWRPWWNCEHFANEALGLPSESPQLQTALTVAGVALLAVVLTRDL